MRSPRARSPPPDEQETRLSAPRPRFFPLPGHCRPPSPLPRCAAASGDLFLSQDNTPGCTNETRDFGALRTEFAAADCAVFGISRDSLKSHENFKAA